MYHYSQQNNGKYTTFTHNGNYYRISPTATLGLEITSNTKITGTLTASGYNDGNWNTAYGWGNHASVGYLTSYNDEYTTGATFNTGNGVITFRRNDGDTFTVDIDGRFASSSHKYHSFSNGDEYYDGYGQNNFLRLFTESSVHDNFMESKLRYSF